MQSKTFSQMYIHIVFSVREREKVLKSIFRQEVLKYITGIVSNKGHKMLEINGVEDHLHILLGLNPSQSVSELIRDIKANSAKFINEKKFLYGHFSWQEGYAAFSIGHSELDRIHNYIRNQEVHHLEESTMSERKRFYKAYGYDGEELL